MSENLKQFSVEVFHIELEQNLRNEELYRWKSPFVDLCKPGFMMDPKCLASLTQFIQFRILKNLTRNVGGDTSHETDEGATNKGYVPTAHLQPYIQF